MKSMFGAREMTGPFGPPFPFSSLGLKEEEGCGLRRTKGKNSSL